MSADFHFAEFCKDGRMDSALKYGRSAISHCRSSGPTRRRQMALPTCLGTRPPGEQPDRDLSRGCEIVSQVVESVVSRASGASSESSRVVRRVAWP
jgi:hypothetical protein